MRDFQDLEGAAWVAGVTERAGGDYKGRFHMTLCRAGGTGEEVSLPDVRWNSERTAVRTLASMSVVELRRRLRSALARAAGPGTA